ncbi:hypothetical protein ALP03_05086, partial [Pseudomonas amygdali pv. tabaci]
MQIHALIVIKFALPPMREYLSPWAKCISALNIQNWRYIMSNSTNETKYFDLHTVGIGYLNRIREVKPRKGNPFMAVTVAALKGSTESVEYTYIDCNVVGAEADKL